MIYVLLIFLLNALLKDPCSMKKRIRKSKDTDPDR